jgi:hypothetical protein
MRQIFTVAPILPGTTVAYTGSYETNIVHPDGVTITRQASWNFVRKQQPGAAAACGPACSS